MQSYQKIAQTDLSKKYIISKINNNWIIFLYNAILYYASHISVEKSVNVINCKNWLFETKWR